MNPQDPSLLEIEWTDFATVKRWKDRLAKKSKKGSLSVSTWKNVKYHMSRFVKCSQLSPDELIEESLVDPEKGESRVKAYHTWLVQNGLDYNAAIIGAYGLIRGFYSHNKINTQDWSSPKTTPKKVEQTDSNYPLFVVNDENELDLNRSLLRDFLGYLNFRDRVIALCLLSTGLDDGDLLKLDVGFVNNSDSRHDRLFVIGYREKTLEPVKTFFSKEATKKLREYVKTERFDAKDKDPLFVTLLRERKRQFKLANNRSFKNSDYDELPAAKRLTNEILSQNFRKAAQNMGIPLQKKDQSPMRPKRLRKVFNDACDIARVVEGIKKVFMGKVDPANKEYSTKNREYLEIYYKHIEPFVTVYSEPVNESVKKLDDENKSLRDSVEELKQKQQADREFFIDYMDSQLKKMRETGYIPK